jgi:hypothetical protein
MNLHQTPEQIINNATAEQRILWNYIFLLFGGKIALQLFYFQGAIAASEFLTYSANKIYFGLNTDFGVTTYPWVATASYVNFYDQANAINFIGGESNGLWDATAAATKNFQTKMFLNNILFSRLASFGYTHIKFIGYRLSI